MDIASSATAVQAQSVSTDAGALMLRKQLDAEKAQAAQLLGAMPTPQPSLEQHLGGRLDLYA